ncbi:hypothetical protein A2797_01545 [candidate division WWE3 bacterium RIFCSPHIGHO2_01_FULL_48_15]|uniref:ABC transporter n=1 Tax=candidate division WWE3 bacterium RIFCSPHIGHO2_01_FULL_48_15 TaxID=1802619 RepID=A0A1F4VBR3_UNCKA|nr:MAG: hypothetical protein A2797_01545 [candidate division WWE3 bacterium RIFCSPHIGHO2_01_FULL_48_15]
MEFFRILWRLMKPFRRDIAIFMAIIVLYEALQIIDSYIFGLVIDFLSRDVGITVIILFFAGLIIYDLLFVRLDNFVDWTIISRLFHPVYVYFKKVTLAKFLEMEMRWHQDQRSGSLVGKVNDGTWKILDMVSGICWEFAPTVIQVFLSFIPLLFFTPITVFVVLAALVIFWAITLRGHRAALPLRIARQDIYEEEWGKMQELVTNVETVVLFNQQERLSLDYEQTLLRAKEYGLKDDQISVFRYGRLRIQVNNIGRRMVLGILVWQVAAGAISIGGMVFAWTLTEKLFHSFWRLARLYDRSQKTLEAARRIEKLLALQPKIANPQLCQSTSIEKVDLELRDVEFSYNENRGEGVQKLNLVILAGETVGVVGPSGAGKTTLRRLLTRTWDIDHGQILINGVDIKNLPLAQVRGAFAHVPQGDEVSIFNESFSFNISLGRPEATKEEIEKAACVAGLHDFISKCEFGYETLLGERGLRLSGGQKQRLSLARAILANCPVLILDEATSSVDSITEDEIQKQLIPILKSNRRTAIVIAHRLATLIGVVDRILVFDGGSLVEEGTHEELLQRRGLYRALYDRQFERSSCL